MAGRTHAHHRRAPRPREHSLDGIDGALRTAQRRLQGPGTHTGIEIDLAAAARIEGFQEIHEARLVRELDEAPIGRLRRVMLDAALESAARELIAYGKQTVGALWVIRMSADVIERGRMGDEPRRGQRAT